MMLLKECSEYMALLGRTLPCDGGIRRKNGVADGVFVESAS
jgi:hypothetical protein